MADHRIMVDHPITGRPLPPGKYQRDGDNPTSYLVICSDGKKHWYVDRDGTKHEPPNAAQLKELFHERNATRCRKFAEPDC